MPIVKGFRRFHSNIVSSREVFTEISSLVAGSNVERSGRSSAAPFTSNRPIRKRVTGADRRVMLESFVNKYRAMNLGKFPSPTSAQKEVGGSYYLIKKMLQEMEYSFKMSPVEKENTEQIKSEDTISSSEISSGSQEKSNSQITIDQHLSEESCLESVSNLDKKIELKEELQLSTSTGSSNLTRDDIHKIATESDDKRGQCHEKNPIDDNFAFEESESKVENQRERTKDIMRHGLWFLIDANNERAA